MDLLPHDQASALDSAVYAACEDAVKRQSERTGGTGAPADAWSAVLQEVHKSICRHACVYNSTHCATACLPAELLGEIFSWLSFGDLLAVTASCQAWRSAALACPPLWSTVPAMCSTAMLERLLARARRTPLSFAGLAVDEHNFENVTACLGAHLDHTKTLNIRSTGAVYEEIVDSLLITLFTPAPSIVDLSLSGEACHHALLRGFVQGWKPFAGCSTLLRFHLAAEEPLPDMFLPNMGFTSLRSLSLDLKELRRTAFRSALSLPMLEHLVVSFVWFLDDGDWTTLPRLLPLQLISLSLKAGTLVRQSYLLDNIVHRDLQSLTLINIPVDTSSAALDELLPSTTCITKVTLRGITADIEARDLSGRHRALTEIDLEEGFFTLLSMRATAAFIDNLHYTFDIFPAVKQWSHLRTLTLGITEGDFPCRPHELVQPPMRAHPLACPHLEVLTIVRSARHRKQSDSIAVHVGVVIHFLAKGLQYNRQRLAELRFERVVVQPSEGLDAGHLSEVADAIFLSN